MRIGILIKQNNHSLTAAIQQGIENFNRADHCQGYAAAEIHFNPDELPPEPVIADLTVVADGLVKPGHVRVCTVDLGAIQELAMIDNEI